MPNAEELGRRIQTARIRAHLSQVDVAKATRLSRDTLRRIEGGASTQDAKRQIVLDYLQLDADGLPVSDTVGKPATLESVDPRLNNIERQIDALWRRIDELGGEQDGGGSVSPIRPPDDGSPSVEAPDESEDDQQIAARDRDVHGNPIINRGRRTRSDQDDAATAPDPEGPEGGA